MLIPKIIENKAFNIVGVSIRTSNAEEMSGRGMIPGHWDRFMKEGLLNRIPNKIDSSILAVYTDYENDVNGEYTFIIGARVSSTEHIPPGMAAKTIPAGQYALFTSQRGFVGKVVPETWSQIWGIPQSEAGGNRTFRADFEVYDHRAANSHDAQVDIYVGIK